MTVTLHSGDYNQIAILYQARREDFFPPNLDDYRPPRFPQLSLLAKLIDRLRNNRLLILVGDSAIDKLEIARYLASELRDQLAHQTANSAVHQLDYQEWSGLNGDGLTNTLARFLEPTVFILPRLHPHNIDYDLARVLQILGPRHYAIATIDFANPWGQWLKDEAAPRKYFYPLTAAETYPPSVLARFFETYLVDSGIDLHRFPTGSDGRPRIANRSIEQIISLLVTPRRVREFVGRLVEIPASEPFTAQQVQDCLKDMQSENTLHAWYQRLDEKRHHHLLALAIYIFDGLAENQFFAAVDMAISQAWRERDPFIRSLDYKDLAALEHFFQFVPMEFGKRSIRTRSPEDRRKLFNLLWEEQRRTIVSTLPLFYRYISEAQEPKPYSELYGSQPWCEQLRVTLTETISEIGMRDIHDVELLLLRLASDNQIGVQAVAARVLARWYELGEHQRVRDLLSQWIGGPSSRELIVISSVSDTPSTSTRSSNLRKTAVLTLAYAAKSERRQKVPLFLVDMLFRLANDKNDSVVDYVMRYALPMLYQRHLYQLHRIILSILRNSTWQETAISFILNIYQKQPTQVKGLLTDWFGKYAQAKARLVGSPQHSVWLEVFRGIMLIYRRLPYNEISLGFSIDIIIEQMLGILTDEHMPPEIRKIALDTVLEQSRSHYRYLQHFILPATFEERRRIVNRLLLIHSEQLNQRDVSVGDPSVTSNQQRGARPTAVEKEVLGWIFIVHSVLEQQISLQLALTFFHARYDTWLGIRGSSRNSIRVKPVSTGQQPLIGLYSNNWYLQLIVARFATIGKVDLRGLVQVSLPVVASYYQQEPEVASQAIRTWERNKNGEVSEFATCLRRALLLLRLGRRLY